MNGQLPTAQSRPLSETIGTTDIDKMLHDYVKPKFLKMTPDNRQKVLDYIDTLAEDGGQAD